MSQSFWKSMMSPAAPPGSPQLLNTPDVNAPEQSSGWVHQMILTRTPPNSPPNLASASDTEADHDHQDADNTGYHAPVGSPLTAMSLITDRNNTPHPDDASLSKSQTQATSPKEAALHTPPRFTPDRTATPPPPLPPRKRALSPHPAPRPAKRVKAPSTPATECGEEDAPFGDDATQCGDDDDYQGDHTQEYDDSLSARQTVIDLSGTAGWLSGILSRTEPWPQSIATEETHQLWPYDDHRSDVRARNIAGSSDCSAGPASVRREPRASRPRYSVYINSFTEEEIMGQVEELLKAARACYLSVDPKEPRRAVAPEEGERSLRILKTIFDKHLRPTEGDVLLSLEEEEDILDKLVGWLRKMPVPPQVGRFGSLYECRRHLDEMGDTPFVKKIKVFVETGGGAHISAVRRISKIDEIAAWRNEVCDLFGEIAEFEFF